MKKDVGYCRTRTRKMDFAEIMKELVLQLSACKKAETLQLAVSLPLKLYALFIQEILEQGKGCQLHEAMGYILKDFFTKRSPEILREITEPNGLLSCFPLGQEKILTDYICNLPVKVASNCLFFASRENIELYLDSIEELLDMLERVNPHKSWLDRLESLVQAQRIAA